MLRFSVTTPKTIEADTAAAAALLAYQAFKKVQHPCVIRSSARTMRSSISIWVATCRGVCSIGSHMRSGQLVSSEKPAHSSHDCDQLPTLRDWIKPTRGSAMQQAVGSMNQSFF